MVTAEELGAPGRDLGACELYMGRWPDPALEGTEDLGLVNPARPHELSADGCPGGWYRTPYVDSVLRYMRRRDDNGNRVENLLLSSAGHQTIEAVLELEREQERAHAYQAERGHAFRESERKRQAAASARKRKGRAR